MKVSLPYGKDEIAADLNRVCCLGILDAAQIAQVADISKALVEALNNPIGMGAPLQQRFSPENSVCIVVSDASRKTRMEQVLPHLIAWLLDCGISERRISFLVATGVHRPSTPEEQAGILGKDIFERFCDRVYNHDAYDAGNLIRVGVTSRGTEVLLNRRACECEHLILTGSAMPHYFAGFGGGRKALMPGLAGATSIAQNHVRSLHATEARLDPRVQICRLDGNPVAEDLLEGALLHPPAFIINTVLNREGNIAGLFAGELDAAHRRACALASEIYTVSVREKADLVIAANNTALNFIQCHKALFNAYNAMKPGGRIILAAPLPEGLGGTGFRRYLEMGDAEAVAAALRRQPDINGQTALSTLEKAAHATMLTGLEDNDVRLLGSQKAASMKEAIERACKYFDKRGICQPTCYIMPNAGNTVPVQSL